MTEQKSKKAKPETRIDEDAISKFAAMGFKEPLPNVLVSAYKAFKKRKDMVSPGRLSAEGIATVSMLADIIESNVTPPKGD